MASLESRVTKAGKSWRIVYADRPNHRQTLVVGVCSKRVAEQRLAEVRTLLAQGRDPHQERRRVIADSMRLSALIELDSSYQANRVQPRTVELTQDAVSRLIDLVGDLMLTDFTPTVATKFIKRFSAGRSPTTINIAIRSLRALFNRAIEIHQVTVTNPFASLRLFTEPSRVRIHFLSPDQIAELRAAVKGTRAEDLIEFYLHTGARRNEATDLKWTDIDFDSSLVWLGSADSQTKKRRSVPISAALKEMLAARRKVFRKSEMVFPEWTTGNLVSLRFVLLRKANPNLPEYLSPHVLRHTFASRLVMAGVDLTTVASFMGHTTTKVTERYAHLAPDHRAAAIERLGI